MHRSVRQSLTLLSHLLPEGNKAALYADATLHTLYTYILLTLCMVMGQLVDFTEDFLLYVSSSYTRVSIILFLGTKDLPNTAKALLFYMQLIFFSPIVTPHCDTY